MSDAASMAPIAAPDSASRVPLRRVGVTQGLVVLAATAAVVAGLYFGQALLIPCVLACLFSFLLMPLVERLQRWGLGNFLSVIISVGLASAVLTVIVAIVTFQVIQLADSLPQYQSNIERKFGTLRSTVSKPLDKLRRVSAAIDKSSAIPDPPAGNGAPTTVAPGTTTAAAGPVAGAPSVGEAAPLTPMHVLGYVLDTTIGPIASACIVVVLVIFTLLERKEIRTRLIRLLGSSPGQLYVSTQALDDASTRVSRYLLMQLVVNVTYGIPIVIGLYLIGVPSAFFWGLLTVLLRFIPYVGPLVAGALPVTLALAVDPGWSMVLWTLGLFIVVELISNNLVEPLLYGNSTGISPLGIILSAVFWAWVWGPIGLLMATPLTACLVVLGRYIPAMSMFPLLLGDQPVLPLHARIFQRLLVSDLDEPYELTQRYLAEHPLEQYYQQVLIPLLCLLEEERHYHSMESSQREFILQRIRDLVEDTADHPDPATKAQSAPLPGEALPGESPATGEDSSSGSAASGLAAEAPPIVLSMPADDASDEVAGRMLTILLHRRGIPAATIRAGSPPAMQSPEVQGAQVQVLCISALPPLAAVRARHRVARAKSRARSAKIILGLWDSEGTAAALKENLGPASNVPIATSLSGAIELILATVERPAGVVASPK